MTPLKSFIYLIRISDTYLAAYTSEDNSSFQELMEDMDRRSKAKFAEQLQIEHNSHLKMLTSSIVPSIEEQAKGIEIPLEVMDYS